MFVVFYLGFGFFKDVRNLHEKCDMHTKPQRFHCQRERMLHSSFSTLCSPNPSPNPWPNSPAHWWWSVKRACEREFCFDKENVVIIEVRYFNLTHLSIYLSICLQSQKNKFVEQKKFKDECQSYLFLLGYPLNNDGCSGRVRYPSLYCLDVSFCVKTTYMF